MKKQIILKKIVLLPLCLSMVIAALNSCGTRDFGLDTKVAGISINPSGDVSIVVGQTTTLTVSVTPSNASNKSVTWSSQNTGIATVDAQTGVVTGVSAGTVIIRATAADGSGVTADKSVTVTSTEVKVTSIAINPSGDVSIGIDSTTTLTVAVTPANATNKNVTWSSQSTGIATVDDQTGVVKGVSAGTTTIRATAADGSGIYADKSVTVTTATSGSSEFGNGIVAATNFGGGSGSQTSPYLINNAQQLKKLVDDVNNGNSYASTFFKLTTDIQVTADQWIPIGYTYDLNNYFGFQGNFDGGGHKIIGMRVNSTTLYASGFFAVVDGSTIQNIGIVNANISSSGSSTVGGVGGLVGQANSATISNCYVTGAISGISKVGSLVGMIAESSNITNCYSTANINGQASTGGIAGISQYSSNSISNCYATGNITGGQEAGGIIGIVFEGSCIINNCYASGEILGTSYIGGIVGLSNANNTTISNCVAINPSIAYQDFGDRVIGMILSGTSATLSNNWASSTMILNYGSGTTTKGSNQTGGADCDAIPTASWWTIFVSNGGPGWSSSVWYFADGQFPILQWQR